MRNRASVSRVRRKKRGPIAELGADRLDTVLVAGTGSSNNRYPPSKWTQPYVLPKTAGSGYWGKSKFFFFLSSFV